MPALTPETATYKTKALVLPGPGQKFEVQDVYVKAKPGVSEVMVEVKAIGICHTDLGVASGEMPYPFPAILGHEGAGIVRAVGEGVTRLSVGDHVSMSYASCGQCLPCVGGSPVYCDHWPALNFGGHNEDLSRGSIMLDPASDAGKKAIANSTDGHPQPTGSPLFGQSSFCQHVVVSQRNCVKVEDKSVPFEVLAPLGCGMQTGGSAVANLLRPEPGSSVAVIGTGAVGLSAIMLARQLSGATTIIAVDIVDSRLELARSLGATHTLNSKTSGGQMSEKLRELAGGKGLDYVIDATGKSAVLGQAMQSLRAQGTVLSIGSPGPGEYCPAEIYKVVMLGLTYKGTNNGGAVPQEFLPFLVNLYKAGRYPVDKLIKTYRYTEIETAVHHMHDGTTIKPVLLFD